MKKRPCPSNITFCLICLFSENIGYADDRNYYKYSPPMVLRVNPVFRKFNSDLFRLQAHFEKINLDPKIGSFYLIFDPLGQRQITETDLVGWLFKSKNVFCKMFL